MSESNRCPRCNGPLPITGMLKGRCPRCMFELGYETAAEGAGDAVIAPLPAAIGRYRILRVIGQGGMGIVYEAEQEQPRRTVALKIIRYGMATPELLRRFEQESQALGRLQHPGIAQIYEAGMIDSGFGPQPYFAMEFIRGLPPRDYAELHQLNTRQRVEIMVKICDAVHHAHQRGLIHRDLKPANILIDETGQPKILDFGVARAIDSDTRTTLQTDMGQLIGTLAYMSPEQALADPLELDTRTDVYAMGVILYELLTGRLPYTISNKIHEAIQSIRDEDPAKVSGADRKYRGDIETVVGKALEKDKARRYQSAFGLAVDLQRYLNDEPIAARPPSARYQLQKFTRRNKTLVTGVAAVFLVLVAGVIVSTTLFLQVRRAHELTKLEASRADDATLEAGVVSEVVFRILQTARFTANQDQGLEAGSPRLKTSIDDAALFVKRGQSQKKPQQEAAARELLAGMYSALGYPGDSRDQLEAAVTLRRSTLGDADPHTLQDTASLAEAYSYLHMYSTAVALAKKVVVDSRRSRGNVDPMIQSAVQIIDRTYRMSTQTDRTIDVSQTEQFLRDDVVDYQRRKYGESNPTVQDAERVLLALYIDYGMPRYSEAEQFAMQIVEERRRALGEGNSATIDAEKQLISLYSIPQPQPKNTEAIAFLKDLVKDQRRTLGDDNPRTQATINYMVNIYLRDPQPNYREAETFLKSVIAETRSRLGSENPATRNASIALAGLYLKQDRNKEAADLSIRYATESAVADAMTHPLPLIEQMAVPDNLGPFSVHTYGGRPTTLRDAMARLSLLEQPSIVDLLDRLAQIYARQGNATEALAATNKMRAILDAELDSTRNVGGWEFGRPLKRMSVMAIQYIEENRTMEADEILKTIMDGYKRVVGQSSNAPEIATLLTSAALTYTGKGNDRRAGEILNAIVKIDEAGVNRNFTLSSSLRRLGAWYTDRGRYEDARKINDRLNKIDTTGFVSGQSSRLMANMAGVYDIEGFIPN